MNPPPRPRRSICLAGLWALVGAATCLGAQDAAGAQNAVATVLEYSTARSWALFAACDADGDDRLTLFESARALPAVNSARDVAAFRRLDADASGFVEWPEFDLRYREMLRARGEFVVVPVHAVDDRPDPAAPPGDDSGDPDVLKTVDGDDDGAISLAEFERFIALVRLDPKLTSFYPKLDSDGDGELSAAEFGIVLGIPGLDLTALARRGPGPGKDSLPEHVRAADRDRDGALDAVELGASLRRVQPGLDRWAEAIIAGADRSRNGRLGGAEIRAAEGERR